MPKKLPRYQPIDQVNHLEVAHKGNAWMVAIKLTDDSTCIVNPVMGMQELVPSGSGVSHLLAPNHYHNKALVAYSEHFPVAQICSTEAANPRLEKITGLTIESLKGLSKRLPTGMTFIEPQGLKTGEVWIRFAVGKNVGWFVIDAFCGSKVTTSNLECNSPELLKTFPSYGVANQDLYKAWVFEQIEHDRPTLIIPCHGSIIRDSKLAIKLEKLVARI